MNRSWNRLITAIPWFFALVAGAAWAKVTFMLILQLDRVLPYGQGTHTLASLFFHPVMLFADTLDSDLLGPRFLIVYYAVLTMFIWNAPGGRRWFRLTTILYGLHMALNFLGCLLYIYPFPQIPGTGQYFLWGDLRDLLELGRQEPFPLMAFGALLLAWHMLAWWRLWLGAKRIRK